MSQSMQDEREGSLRNSELSIRGRSGHLPAGQCQNEKLIFEAYC